MQGVALLVTALCALFIAACGSGSGGSAANTGSSSSGSTAASTSSSGGGKLASGTIGVVLGTAQSEVEEHWVTTIKAADSAMGWKTEVTDGQGEPNIWGQAITSYVTQKVAGIIIIGLDAPPVAPQLQAAKEAGIPVIASGISVAPADRNLLAAVYAPSDAQFGVVAANWLATHEPKGSQFTQLDVTANYGAHQLLVGADPVLKAKGFDLAGDFDMTITNIATEVSTGSTELANAHPDEKFMLTCCDLTPAIAVPALAQSGHSSVVVVSRYDNLSTLALIRAGKPVVTVAANADSAVLTAVGQIFAHSATGASPNPTADAGIYKFAVVNKQNVPPAGQYYYAPAPQITQFVKKWKQEYCQ